MLWDEKNNEYFTKTFVTADRSLGRLFSAIFYLIERVIDLMKNFLKLQFKLPLVITLTVVFGNYLYQCSLKLLFNFINVLYCRSSMTRQVPE